MNGDAETSSPSEILACALCGQIVEHDAWYDGICDECWIRGRIEAWLSDPTQGGKLKPGQQWYWCFNCLTKKPAAISRGGPPKWVAFDPERPDLRLCERCREYADGHRARFRELIHPVSATHPVCEHGDSVTQTPEDPASAARD